MSDMDRDERWQQAENGYWYHPQIEGAWYTNQQGQWRRHVPPSNAPKAVVVLLGCAVGFGGCALIVVHPVVALAAFFVGIPFVLVVWWFTRDAMDRV